MTTQLASQLSSLGVQLFVLVVLPVLGYFAARLLNAGIASIHDTRLQKAAAQAVSYVEATVVATGPQKFDKALGLLQTQFPTLPVARFTPVIEDELAKLQMTLGTFKPAQTSAEPLPAPLPVLDSAALKSALTTGLSTLLPPSLLDQGAALIAGAFASAVTTIDKAQTPVVDGGIYPPVEQTPLAAAPAPSMQAPVPVAQPPVLGAASASLTAPLGAVSMTPTPQVTEPTKLA